MPNDKNGLVIEKGQIVTMEFTVEEVYPGDEYLRLASVEPIWPEAHKAPFLASGRQVVVVGMPLDMSPEGIERRIKECPRPGDPAGPTLLRSSVVVLLGALGILGLGGFEQRAEAQVAGGLSGTGPMVTAVISSQGTDVIKQTTGYAAKNAVLARIDICNIDPQNDHNQSVSAAIAAIMLQEQYSIYGSDVVSAVMAQLQSRDVFTRAQKAIAAGSNTATLITALFKTLTPLQVSVIQAAPAIAQAILPAVGDPRDLAVLGQKILQDNSALTLGKRGSGNDCHTGLAVVMATTVKIDKVVIQ